MTGMDIFNDDAFSLTSLTDAITYAEYVPQYLASIPGLVQQKPVRTEEIWIEERSVSPEIIPTSPRATPMPNKGGRKRDARSFRTLRIALSSTIRASEIQGVRAFGSESELQQVQAVVAERQADLRRDFALTEEFHLLNLIQGYQRDKLEDGSVVDLNDWATEFGQTRQSMTNFLLTESSPAIGVLRKRIVAMRRKLAKALKGIGGMNVSLHALCGDEFYDAFTSHNEVHEKYVNTPSAKEFSDVGGAYEHFDFAGVRWHNYRGTDDGTTVAIPSKEVRIFPTNAGIFQKAVSPGESFDVVNTLGQNLYSRIITDDKRNEFVDVEMLTYPLWVCTKADALFSGKMAT